MRYQGRHEINTAQTPETERVQASSGAHRSETAYSRFKRERLPRALMAVQVGAVALKMSLGLHSAPIELPPVKDVHALPAAVVGSSATPPVFVPTERPHYEPRHAASESIPSYSEVAPLGGPAPMEASGPTLPSLPEQARIVREHPFIKV